MQNVSYTMQALWLSFAARKDPNDHGLSWVPQWPSYDEGRQNFVLNGTLDDTVDFRVEKDDFRDEGIRWFNDRWDILYSH